MPDPRRGRGPGSQQQPRTQPQAGAGWRHSDPMKLLFHLKVSYSLKYSTIFVALHDFRPLEATPKLHCSGCALQGQRSERPMHRIELTAGAPPAFDVSRTPPPA